MLIIRTMPYSLEEMIQILTIRATTESIDLAPEAVETLAEIGSKTSLRYAVQLLTPSRILSETQGNKAITCADVREINDLFYDAKASAKCLAQSEGYLQ